MFCFLFRYHQGVFEVLSVDLSLSGYLTALSQVGHPKARLTSPQLCPSTSPTSTTPQLTQRSEWRSNHHSSDENIAKAPRLKLPLSLHLLVVRIKLHRPVRTHFSAQAQLPEALGRLHQLFQLFRGPQESQSGHLRHNPREPLPLETRMLFKLGF